MNQIDLSIILPAYMEAGRITGTLKTLSDFLDSRDYGNVEVIVVVADSPDGTAELARAQSSLFRQFRVIDAGPKVGKGRDVRLGIFEARGRYRLFMDADLATPLHHLDDVWKFIQSGGVVGIAVRNLSSIHDGLLRKGMSVFGNLLAQAVLVPGLKDTQCGFKVFKADAAEELFSRMLITGWGFDMELLAIARRLKYPITTIPAPDWTDPKADDEGFTGESAVGAALQVFRDLFRVKLNLLRGEYDRHNYVHHRFK